MGGTPALTHEHFDWLQVAIRKGDEGATEGAVLRADDAGRDASVGSQARGRAPTPANGQARQQEQQAVAQATAQSHD